MASRHAEQAMMTERCYVVCHPIDRNLVNQFPVDYQAKVLVVASSLDEVFPATNNVELNEREERIVTPLGCEWFRSTSVGDVVIESTKRAFLCSNVGWTPIKGSCSVLPFWWFADEMLVGLIRATVNQHKRGTQ
jgi:hypothetical protein